MPRGVVAPGKVDKRTMRATGRTQQFATRVTAEFHERLKALAESEGLMIVEILERALDAYERERASLPKD